MLYGPDDLSSEDEDGFSDDNEYYEFKQKLKSKRSAAEQAVTISEEEKKKIYLNSIFNAICYGKTESVITELDNGLAVDADLELNWTPLLLASTRANYSIISELIKRGSNIHQSRDFGTNALMLLCNISSNEENAKESILPCVKLLVEKGINVNAIDNKRKTAIMFAASNGHIDVVQFLLPLIDKAAVDNQRWNVLFWAVDGNHLDLVKILLAEGFSIHTKDIRENTVLDLAQTNSFQEILDLFPKDPLDELLSHMHNNEKSFEETFAVLQKNKKPQFFKDICQILCGTKSEHVMPIIYNNNINLFEFLSMTDLKLEKIGLQFPYQRNRIMGGLYKFHKYPFKPQSIPFIQKNQLFSNIDISVSVLTCIKQLIAMEASLKFMIENRTDRLSLAETKEVNILIRKLRSQLSKLKPIVAQLEQKAKQWDLHLKPADRITKKRRNIPWGHVYVSVGIITLFILYKIK